MTRELSRRKGDQGRRKEIKDSTRTRTDTELKRTHGSTAPVEPEDRGAAGVGHVAQRPRVRLLADGARVAVAAGEAQPVGRHALRANTKE